MIHKELQTNSLAKSAISNSVLWTAKDTNDTTEALCNQSQILIESSLPKNNPICNH